MSEQSESALENQQPAQEVWKKRGRGRPVGSKNHSLVAQFRDMKRLKALLESSTVKEAYKKLNPNATDKTAVDNGHRILTPELFNRVKELMGFESVIKANRDMLEKVLFMVIDRWLNKEEKTPDMIAAVKELTKLVPEFSDKLQIEDISKASEEELDRKLRSFGYDPNRLTAN